MTEMGESSQIREVEPRVTGEEEPRDIHTVFEQLVPREPSPLITVVGPEYEPESDPEEDPEEVPFTPTDDEMDGARYDHSIDWQDRARHLEEIADIRQAVIEQKNEEVQDLEVRLGDVEDELIREKSDKEQLLAEVDKLKKSLREESAKRARAEEAWIKVADRADRIEDEVRSKKARMDEMDYVFHTAMSRAQDRVYHYPVQFEDLPWYMMDRRTMCRIMEEERAEAVRRLNMRR